MIKRWASYVDEQRESLRRYALQAEPLVRFLTKTHGVTLLTRRWAGIVDDVTTFDQKMAGNGLGSLDVFLRDGLPQIVPEKECGATAGLVPVRTNGSFFIGVRNDMLDDVVKHCRELARSGVQARYAAIAQSFNTLLASRYPFTQGLEGTRDSTPADVLEFLRVYDRQDGRSLAAQLQARSCGEEPARFLRRMDALYPVFTPARELPGGAVALDVVPEFRVNRDREIGGSEIAQWTMDIGRQTIRDGDPPKPARWVLGDPVQLTLRFAKDSPEKPIALSSAWRKLIDPRTVRMEFQGTWSLLSLLRAGRAAPTDLLTAADAAPNTLRFDIPVERDLERRAVVTASQPPPPAFRVYVRVRVFQPGKQDPIAVDEFPVQAPATVSCPGT
jgi:type VI secretion system protein ImpL